ncbi:carboxypeptidase regulatory-like domain-containing protein [bacterium]|nr:carboxypeptidase regulatory-like domain-containing protein [bacterium]
MRSRPVVSLFAVILLLWTVAAAAAEPVRVPLASGASGTFGEPSGEAAATTAVALGEKSAAGLTLRFSAPWLELTSREADGTTWQAVELPGAASVGAPGAPQLPLVTQLVAVPDGRTLQVKSVSEDMRQLAGTWRPWPDQGLQQGDAATFVFDAASYAAGKAAAAEPLVSVGEPGLLRGVRVVPVRFRPVRWNAADGSLEAAASLEVSFAYVAAADGRKSATDRAIPESFARMLQDEVIDYTPTGLEMDTPGTYLVIYPEVTGIAGKLDPLLAWRRRQGYNVIATSTNITGGTTAAIKSYIQGIYDTADPPLEFVTLVGDANGAVSIPTFIEGLSGYGGEGDHDYTLLAGGDVMSDVHIGRISVTSTDELATVVGKIVAYESEPLVSTDPGWFTRAGLAADPSSSGYSTIWVSQWVKEQLLALNYTTVDTIWGGNFTTLMLQSVNAGKSIFTYRGYFGMSGMSTSHIASMSNGQKLPFALIVTCDTGSFESDTVCRSEAFLRAPNGGGVASMGTATIGTHTRYNNCMFQGVAEGVLNGDGRVGPGLTLGKLHLYENYQDFEPDEVIIWSTWNNLMGDPATRIWTALPQALVVDHPASLAVGANTIPVSVTAGGSPVADALVAVSTAGGYVVSGRTDAAGRVNVPLSGLAAGPYDLVVTGHNLQPYVAGFNVGAVAAQVDYVGALLSDASGGDGNGLANPGEDITLDITLRNDGTGSVSGVTATLGSGDPRITVTQGSAAYGFLGAGASAAGDVPFAVSVAADAPGGTTFTLELTATDGSGTWTSLVDVAVTGPAAELEASALSALIGPGGSANLDVTLRNLGNQASSGATATLVSHSDWVEVTDASATIGAMAIGGTGATGADDFAVSASLGAIPGHVAALELQVVFAEGGTCTLPVLVTVGEARSTDPVGPDRYGYYAFDDTDTGWGQAPTSAWIEISPDLGGSGTSVGLTDYDRYSDDVVILDLPFPFTYYGETFTRISVCSNGWFSFGATDLRHYRNWHLPSPGTPDNMVAVYWDDLEIKPSGSGVWWWHDTANDRLVIEWHNMANAVTGATETFQAVLVDPAADAGDTGDGVIVMNYQTVTPTDSQTGYATVGIQNGERDDAVLYTYWNAYPVAAAPLVAGRSIAFRTVAALPQGQLSGTVTCAGNGAPVDGAQVHVIGAGKSTLSSLDGSYGTSLNVGAYAVAVSHPSFAPDTTWAVTILEDAETVADFALVDIAGPELTLLSQPESSGDTAGPYDVVYEARDYSGMQDMHFYYTSSTSGGPFELVPQPDGPADTWRVSIPGQPNGTRVQYWLTAADVLGLQSTSPADAPTSVHAFTIAQTTVVYANDMESAGDWTAGAAGDDALTGVWENVDPNGVFSDPYQVVPEDDFNDPGTLCWITGQDPVGGAQGGNDIDNGTTTLLSPVLDLGGHSSLALSYRRWYTNDTGNNPAADAWVVQARDAGGAWVDLENTTASDRSWSFHTFDLDGLLTPGANFQVRFVASDLGSGSVVEAGVDDFMLTSTAPVVDAAPPTVSLTAPAGGGSYDVGATVPVTWNHADDTGVVHVEIRLSTDGGATWDTVLAAGAFNQTWDWTVPDLPGTTNRVKVICHDAAGNAAESASAADFTISSVSGADDVPVTRVALGRNHPNPFNPRTSLRFSLPARQEVSLKVYDVNGRLVRTLVAEMRDAGVHTVVWNGEDDRGGRAASGLYFARLVSGNVVQTRKMTLLK